MVLAGLLLAGGLAHGQVARTEGQGIADLSRVFGSWDDWASAYGDLVSAIDAFVGLSEEPLTSPERLLAVMEARDQVYRTARGVEGYLYVRLQLSGADEEARSREHLTDETDRRWSTQGAPWFRQVVTELGRERIEEWMAGDEALRRYAFFFRRFFDVAGHAYPEGQDDFRALSRTFGQQSARVYRALANSEAPVVEVALESGERVEITPARARTILWELPSAADRAKVSRSWLEAIGRQSQTYGALLEGIVGRQKILADLRGFDSALSAQLHTDAIPADDIRGAVRVAREGTAPLRRYHALRKRVLGLDAYGLADRFFSLETRDREGGGEIDYGDARRLILESSLTLGPEVQDLVRRAFSEGWIDSIERPGKRPHGGATFVAGHPFVLVNYRESLDALFQLAHELGHAVHSQIAFEAQPFVYSHPSSLTSEAVASVFEGVLVDQIAGQATSLQEKVRVLDLSIQNLLRLFYRPMLDADFELRLYETKQPMTGPSLDALYLAVVGEFYGETVQLHDWDRHGWQQTPHFYTSPLYLGRYGLSSGAASVLISRLTSPIDAEAATARRAFLDLMRSGASAYPVDLLSRAGVDLHDPGTIEAPAARLEKLVGELQGALRIAEPQPVHAKPRSKASQVVAGGAPEGTS